MDLVLSKARPSAEETQAIDAVLGPPGSGWEGGARRASVDGHFATGGHEARARRHLLLPALHAAQGRVGWISEGALNYISRRLTIPPSEAYGVASFYALFSLERRPETVAHVCDDVVCRVSGATEICAGLERALGPAGSDCLGGTATWLRSPCLGLCERAPAVLVTRAGSTPLDRGLAPATSAGAIEMLRGGASRPDGLAAGHAVFEGGAREAAARLPQSGEAGLRLLRRVGQADPSSLDAYRAHGGFRALRRAIDIGADAVIREVIDSKLVGRGGAAFPTGRKWEAVARAA
ncbi:MAG TPA: NAD(P)H-dependent oxidoreductase subunit E, partial [Candidatus Polarisedimenticolia bacterium]|nr:NAD(P)H-dependent oxidoreductase subunit E [Candidatus Polarisedimenticolia bacterium]